MRLDINRGEVHQISLLINDRNDTISHSCWKSFSKQRNGIERNSKRFTDELKQFFFPKICKTKALIYEIDVT